MDHISVLKEEVISYLNIKESGIYVDATLGGGGHSSSILEKLTTGKLYAFDQDEYAINVARDRLARISPNFEIIKANFVNLKEELQKRGVTKIDGILYDLGVSSFQFDDTERGFSYRFDARLDMRMNKEQELDAHYVINNYSEEALANVFYKYGEEKYARQIAKKIVLKRKEKEIDTTFELVDIIKSALPYKELNKKGHPAKQVFQALRIEVNDELRVFENSLLQAIDMLKIGGIVAVITFHSLEDRICKTIFKEKSTVFIPKGLPVKSEEVAELELVTRHPVIPSEEEIENNNRAHSAKLRVARKQTEK